MRCGVVWCCVVLCCVVVWDGRKEGCVCVLIIFMQADTRRAGSKRSLSGRNIVFPGSARTLLSNRLTRTKVTLTRESSGGGWGWGRCLHIPQCKTTIVHHHHNHNHNHKCTNHHEKKRQGRYKTTPSNRARVSPIISPSPFPRIDGWISKYKGNQ